jgi:hypothetical protein
MGDRSISNNTGAVVYMDKDEENRSDLLEKTIIVTGTRDQAENARKEIECKRLLIQTW